MSTLLRRFPPLWYNEIMSDETNIKIKKRVPEKENKMALRSIEEIMLPLEVEEEKKKDGTRIPG